MTNPICKRALETWGEAPQMMQCIEEMAELTKEILKNINRKKDNVAEIIEEAADVEIMLEQLKANYKIEEQVAQYKADKLLKIEQRLNEWDKKKA